jgi:hypothetical protein
LRGVPDWLEGTTRGGEIMGGVMVRRGIWEVDEEEEAKLLDESRGGGRFPEPRVVLRPAPRED